MTDETQLKIFGLIDMAERQQAELSAAIEALKAERDALRTDVADAVRQSMAEASQTATAALETATTPVLNRLAGVTNAAARAEERLRGAVAWFSWRWAAIAGATAGGLVFAAWLSIAAIAGFYQGRLGDVQADIAEQEAVLKKLTKAGGKARLSTCGPAGQAPRPCVQIDKTAGEFKDGFFVIRGY